MDRKKALATAGAVSGTLFAASTAFALTGGVLGTDDADGAGALSPVRAELKYVKDATALDGGSSDLLGGSRYSLEPAPRVWAPDGPEITESSASGSSPTARDDDRDDDRGAGERYEEHEDDDWDERYEEHDEEHHHFEGADDDD